MKITGLQKLTLLDYPEKCACTVFTSGCNFRCPFCHNASLVLGKYGDETVDTEEFFDFLGKRRGILDGVCITGGEPLIQDGLDGFIRRIREMGFLVKLDTNGYLPKKLKALVRENLLDYVAMDVKNCEQKYGQTVGIENFDFAPVRESMDFLMGGSVPFEFRTTVVKQLHTVEDMTALAHMIKGTKKYFMQSYKDSGDVLVVGLSAHDTPTLREMLERVRLEVPDAEIRGVDL